MAIDKGLYAAPVGLEAAALEQEVPELEIEIEDPESVELGIDGQPILRIEKGEDEDKFDENLAEKLPESVLTELAGDLIGDFDEDVSSRKDWIQTYVDGIQLLGMKIEDRAEPWEGACGVYHPLLSETLVRFQAETIMETFPAMGPVKTTIIGKETQEKKDAALRVAADMNYRLTVKNKEFRPEHERMLWGLGLAGNAFKKVYYDPSYGRQVSLFIPPEDVIVPYGASNIETAERVTHVMRKTENEIAKLQSVGFYRDVERGEPVRYHSDIEEKKAEEGGYTLTEDNRYALYEVHADLVIAGIDDEEDLAKPYVVTIDKGTGKVLAIRRNWSESDPLLHKQQYFVHYVYVPGFGFYGLGLIHIVGGYARAGTMLIRQLVDAGTLSNLPGGFKTRGMRIKGDDTPIAPGEWRDADVASGTLKDNLMALPYKEPSQTLAGLMDKIRNFGAGSRANRADYVDPQRQAQKMMGFSKGGSVSSASKRADGCAVRGKTKGRMV